MTDKRVKQSWICEVSTIADAGNLKRCWERLLGRAGFMEKETQIYCYILMTFQQNWPVLV